MDLEAALSALSQGAPSAGELEAAVGEQGGRGYLEAVGFRGVVGETATLAVRGRLVIAVGVQHAPADGDNADNAGAGGQSSRGSTGRRTSAASRGTSAATRRTTAASRGAATTAHIAAGQGGAGQDEAGQAGAGQGPGNKGRSRGKRRSGTTNAGARASSANAGAAGASPARSAGVARASSANAGASAANSANAGAGLTADDIRTAAAALSKAAANAESLATTLHQTGADRQEAIRALVEGIALPGYRYQGRKPAALHDVTLVYEDASSEDARVLAAAEVGVRATVNAREWVNRPSGDLTPRSFAVEAADMATEAGLDVEVWDEERIAAESLGLLASVAAGSEEPPRLVRITYRPKSPQARAAESGVPARAAESGVMAHLALVGKGITFDSGGLSLKPAKSMETMKSDMGGAAAVLAATLACADLKPDVWVDGWLALAENMPSGGATRPGDVITARNGTTVEVLNTDAEGRLVLADAMLVAGESNPDLLVDIATLTGGQRIALGPQLAAVLGNDDPTVDQVLEAGSAAGEPGWRLPLWQPYRGRLDSNVADLRNVAGDPAASTITAALFLERFAGQRPWVHIDIASPSYRERAEGWLTKGGTGWGARTLINLIQSRSEATKVEAAEPDGAVLPGAKPDRRRVARR